MAKMTRNQWAILIILGTVLVVFGILTWLKTDTMPPSEAIATTTECCNNASQSSLYDGSNNLTNSFSTLFSGTLGTTGINCPNIIKQPKSCPTAGVPAAPNCNDKCTHGRARPKIENNNGGTCTSKFNNTNLTCTNQHTWMVSKGLTMPTQQPAPLLQHQCVIAAPSQASGLAYSVLSVDTNPGVYSLAGGKLHLEISNAGDCDTKIVNMLVSLEQSVSGTIPGKVWAVSGLENADLMHACQNNEGTTSPAHICDSICDVAVDYTPGHLIVSNLNAPIPGATSCTKSNTMGLDVNYEFVLPSEILNQPSTTQYFVRTRVTLDSCCENSNACGIDYNCDGVNESVRTLEIVSNGFTFGMDGNCKDRCVGVGVKDTLSFYASINGSFPDQLPVVLESSLSAPGLVPVTVTNTSLICCDNIRQTIAQAPNRPDYDPKAAVTMRLNNKACLTLPSVYANTCTLNDASSALGPCTVVPFTFQCAAIVDCQQSAFALTSTDVNCATRNVTLTSTRIVTVPPSNGGAPCGSAQNISVVALTYTQWTVWSACDNDAEPPARSRSRHSINYGSCQETEYLNSTLGAWSAWSTCNGAYKTRTRQTNVGCEVPIIEDEYQVCQITNCLYTQWTAWTTTDSCYPSICTMNETRSRTITAQPQNGGTPCGSLAESRLSACSTDCTHDNNELVCDPFGACEPSTCLQSHSCSIAPDQATYCASGSEQTCATYVQNQTAPCTTGCVYGSWSVWSNSSECVSSTNDSACTQSQNRLRSPLYSCPLGTSDACTATSESQIVSCTCPIIPSPSFVTPPVPSPAVPTMECMIDNDCATTDLCDTRGCINGKCVVISTLFCPTSDLCSASTCDHLLGSCIVGPKLCNDNNPCTDDTCDAGTGACVYTLRTQTTMSPCDVATCNTTTGNFSVAPKVCANGTKCDPNDPAGVCRTPCTIATDSNYNASDCNYIKVYQPNGNINHCSFAVCNNYGSLTIRECALTSVLCLGFGNKCDPATGGCISPPTCPITICPSDKPLLDIFTCTCYYDPALCVNTTCTTAFYNTATQSCVRTNKTCNDNNLCTEDSLTCIENVGCSNTPIICPEHSCFQSGCSPATGCYSAPLICPAVDNPCSLTYCDGTTGGQCDTKPKCASNDPCVYGATCNATAGGTCSPGVRISGCCTSDFDCPGSHCNIINGASNGVCAPLLVVGGCPPETPILCSTDSVCPTHYTCTSGVCKNMSPAACTDNDPCTSNTYCVNGACTSINSGYGTDFAYTTSCHTINSNSCSNNVCTTTGCVAKLDDTLCNDGDRQTIDICSSSQCQDSVKHCQVCPYTGAGLAVVIDFADCTCT